MDNETNVTVIDSLMGSGKTTWAIEHLRANPEERFIYITPLLEECTRVQQAIQTPERSVYTPMNCGDGKLDGLNQLLQEGRNVVCTHELFKRITKEILDLIRQNGYLLFIDEEVSVFRVITFKEDGDLRILEEAGLLRTNEQNEIVWCDKLAGFKTSVDYLKDLTRNRSLYRVDNSHLVWKYPSEVFRAAKHVYVMTYLFDGSTMKPYFHMEHIDYQLRSVRKTSDGHELIPYAPADTRKFQNLIHVYQGKMNKGKRPSLSANWYKTQPKKSIVEIRKNLLSYRRSTNATVDEFLWTTYLNGYNTMVTSQTRSTFLSCTTKGTNAYADRWKLAYMINRYAHPTLNTFYKVKNVPFNSDLWALSEMLQWIWRSRIRREEPIELFVPAQRMRTLLYDWMHPTVSYLN